MTTLDATTTTPWEMVVGLEVHCELKTATQLFCGCPNAFGDEPNTNICPVCLGLPGSLPVLNETSVEYAMRIGEALHCEIKRSIFHRKNYFYPDMPKDYQVSQYDEPINVEGYLELPDGIRIAIERAHMEEDTGKSTHMGATGRIQGAAASLVDYNRAGVPLVEIVSKPDIRSAEQAKAYVGELRAIVIATGAGDGKMEEGSLRVDANVSMRRGPDAEFGTRCEIKNLNSLRSLGHAIEYEAQRQVEILESGERIVQETRHWVEGEGRTVSGRKKEEAMDYRYFPEPDLVPVDPTPDLRARVLSALPIMPAERRSDLLKVVGNESRVQVGAIVEMDLDRLVSAAVAAGADPKLAVNRAANDVATDIGRASSLDPASFAELLKMESSGVVTATQSKVVLAELLKSGGSPAAIALAKGFEAMGDEALERAVDEAIAAHPDECARYRDGEKKIAGFFVGKIMAATQGKADGKAVTALLNQKLLQ